jgi:hypothetical protein
MPSWNKAATAQLKLKIAEGVVSYLPTLPSLPTTTSAALYLQSFFQPTILLDRNIVVIILVLGTLALL